MGTSFNDEKPGSKSPEWRQIVMLRSLECLYSEACGARLEMVARLLGAAIEAIKDELGAAAVAAKVSRFASLPDRDLMISRLLAALREIEDAAEDDPEPDAPKLTH